MAAGRGRLALHSTEGQIQVEAARPEGRFGVRSGDRILRVDDTPVYQIDHLSRALIDSPAARAYLLLRRERRLVSVAVDVDAWRQALDARRRLPAPPLRSGNACMATALAMLDGWRRALPAYGYEHGSIGAAHPFLQNCLMPSILIIDDNASVGTALDVLFSCMTSTPCRRRARLKGWPCSSRSRSTW